MSFQYSKEYVETELIRCRSHLISYPNHSGAIDFIKKWEEFLKKNYPDSELLIKEHAAKTVKNTKKKKNISSYTKTCMEYQYRRRYW